MIRALLGIAVIPLFSLGLAIPAAPADATAAPVDVVSAGPFCTDVIEEQTTTSSVPEPPSPSCVLCPMGYHCAHNPERCVAD